MEPDPTLSAGPAPGNAALQQKAWGKTDNPAASAVAALGTWAFGGTHWGGATRDSESRDTVHAAWDCGVRHFDTAESYGKGRAELVLGQALKTRVQDAFLASKVMPQAAGHFAAHVERSLRRLGREHLDLLYLHWPHPKLDLRAAMEELTALKAAGRVKAIGVSNLSAAQLEALIAGGLPPDWCQDCYNLLWRRPEAGLLALCAGQGIRFAAYSPLAQGLLTDGRHHGSPPGAVHGMPALLPGDNRLTTVFFTQGSYPEAAQEQSGVENGRPAMVAGALRTLSALAAEHGLTLQQLALRWLAGKGVLPVAGARNPGQARALFSFALEPLPPALAQAAEAASAGLGQLFAQEPNIFRHRF